MARHGHRQTTSGGFTIIELMVTLAVLVVIVSLGLPGLQGFVSRNRLTAQANEFVTALSYARSEATKRGLSVGLCRSANADGDLGSASCDTSANSGWERGWLVIADADGDGNLEPGEPRLQAGSALAGTSTTLRGNAATRDRIRFDSQGLAQGAAGTLTLCDGRHAADARYVVIAFTGRARIARQAPNASTAPACPPA